MASYSAVFPTLSRLAASRTFKLLSCDDGLATAFSPARSCGYEARAGALLNQISLRTDPARRTGER